MWYVLQVKCGNEEAIVDQCRKIIDSEVLQRCFVPYYEDMKKYGGKWHKEKSILFPGYIFLISENLQMLYVSLKEVIGLTKLIGTGEEIVAISDEEIAFLETFGKQEQIVKMSKGVIEGDKVVMISGPLQGNEGYIKKIDRHKRKAYLEIELFGRKIEAQVGLEIVEKR